MKMLFENSSGAVMLIGVPGDLCKFIVKANCPCGILRDDPRATVGRCDDGTAEVYLTREQLYALLTMARHILGEV